VISLRVHRIFLDCPRTTSFPEASRFRDRVLGIRSGVLIVVLMSACAKIGDPLPPLIRIPQPLEFQLVQQARDGVELILASLPEDLREIWVYRQCGEPSSNLSKNDLLARVKPDSLLAHQVPGNLVFKDPQPDFDRPCRYGVRVSNRQGRLSAFSAVKETNTLIPPGPPSALEGKVYEDKLVVSWDAPNVDFNESDSLNALGYLVNSQHFVSDPMFIDRDFNFGKPSSYRVQTVGNRRDPTVLSAFSPILTIVPEDTFPPRVPQNVTAVSLGTRVQLLWDANNEPDLDGYFVFRGSGGSKLTRLTPRIGVSRYVDEKAPTETTLHYAVSAVDTRRNESRPSEQVTVTLGQ
jgi:hypothetical protein